MSTILFVDDNEVVRRTGRLLLEELGYEVIMAENGVAAIEAYRQRGPEITFVILDLIMPVMDGADAFIGLRQLDPSVKILISSAHLKTYLEDEVRSLGATGFVQKPYTLEALANDINSALGKSHLPPCAEDPEAGPKSSSN